MVQNETAGALKRDSTLIMRAILIATALLAGFAAFGATALGFELVTLFRH